MKKENTFKVLTGLDKGDIFELSGTMLVREYPNFFAPYKFTTEDGVDIYGDEECARLFDGVITFGNYNGAIEDAIYFSTVHAAQAHLDEQNKPKFEVGDFVHWNGFNPASGNCFKLSLNFDDKTTYSHDSCHHSNLVKMSDKEIESALIKEAERRGFKEGVEIKRCDNLRHYAEAPDCNVIVVGTETNYSTVDDSLEYGDRFIYHKGKWASIISEPEKEKTTSEWIRSYKDSDMGLSEFVKKNNLIITKAPCNA